MDTLILKKRFWSNAYNFFSKDKKIGQLKFKIWSKSAYGELNGQKYTFKTKGFFKPVTQIFDDDKVIGKITYGNWRSKAIIFFNDKKYNWKYDNFWNSKWQIFDSDGVLVHYDASFMGGKIQSNTDDESLILSGVVSANHYNMVGMMAVIIVITTISH